jgi:DNA-binding transcriptional LysR family regulator
MIDPDDMLLFASVVRHGGFSAAARALGISKQAVSERIARLEAELQVSLLLRTTRSVRVTEAGAAFGARAVDLAALVDEAVREAHGMELEPTGTLRVSAPTVFGRRVLGPVVESLLRSHDRLTIELRLTDRRVHLVDEGFDVVIRVGPLEDSSLHVRPMGEVRACIVGTRAVALGWRPRTLAGLAAAPTIATQPNEVWTLGGQKVRLRPRLLVDDLEAAHDAARRGIGFARLPEPVCAEDLARGTLVEILRPASPPAMPVNALLAPNRRSPAKVVVFLDALRAAMRSPARRARSEHPPASAVPRAGGTPGSRGSRR